MTVAHTPSTAVGTRQRNSQSQSYITTDSQSVYLGIEPNLGLLTKDLCQSLSIYNKAVAEQQNVFRL
jgi:hypothetical protein